VAGYAKPIAGAVFDTSLEFGFLDKRAEIVGVAGRDLGIALAPVLREVKPGVQGRLCTSSLQACLMSSPKTAAVMITSDAARCGEMAARSNPGNGLGRPSALGGEEAPLNSALRTT
jgi:hypothetical protein